MEILPEIQRCSSIWKCGNIPRNMVISTRKYGKYSWKLRFPHGNTGNIPRNTEISTGKFSWEPRAAPPDPPRRFGRAKQRKKFHFSFPSQHKPDKEQGPGGSQPFGVGIWGHGAKGETPERLRSFSGAFFGLGFAGKAPQPGPCKEHFSREKGPQRVDSHGNSVLDLGDFGVSARLQHNLGFGDRGWSGNSSGSASRNLGAAAPTSFPNQGVSHPILSVPCSD